MAIIFNEISVSREPLGRGATRQRLLTTTLKPIVEAYQKIGAEPHGLLT